MILRRFMQHVKDQNWFAVGLDVIVVIVGIFLGMQVQQWYEERREAEFEQGYLIGLDEDMAESFERQAEDIKEMRDAAADVREAAQMLINKRLNDENRSEFDELFKSVFNGDSLSHNVTTIRQIFDANHLSVFKSDEVKKAISNNLLRYEKVSSQERINADILYRNAIEGLLDNVSIDIESKKILMSNSELIQNPLIYRKLVMISRMQTSKALLYSHMLDETKKLRDVINQQLSQ